MLPSTIDAIKAVLRTDETLNPRERSNVLAQLRQSPDAAKLAATPSMRLIRRREAAARLGVSFRTYDKLTRELGLRRKLPNRVRAIGINEEDLNSLIAGRITI